MQALLQDQEFESVEELNQRIEELNRRGQISKIADAWKSDDPKWRAQDLAYEAAETDDLETALRLIGEALTLDEDCTEAERLIVSLLPMEPENRIKLMREVVEKAERNFGDEFFEKQKDHFWEDVSTRPYMRAKRHLAELLMEAGELEEAIAVFERILELNSMDNQAVRYPLLGLYLASDRRERAGDLISRHPDEEKFSAVFAWGRVLERWLAGETAEAEAALERAREGNPYVEDFLTGEQELPEEAPDYYQPGKDSEAQVCALELAIAWKKQPAFREWLRERGVS